VEWDVLARIPTLVVLMGFHALTEMTHHLLAHGRHPSTPAAVVSCGTMPDQRTVTGPLATIADLVRDAALTPPATLVVGDVVRLREVLRDARDHDREVVLTVPGAGFP
jgi:siroheme synthase